LKAAEHNTYSVRKCGVEKELQTYSCIRVCAAPQAAEKRINVITAVIRQYFLPMISDALAHMIGKPA
jgi:hypothetical protein